MRINEIGNIGIGTIHPHYNLHMEGSGARLFIENEQSKKRAGIGVSIPDEGGFLSLYDVNEIKKAKISATGNSYFNGGNIGIGTSLPPLN